MYKAAPFGDMVIRLSDGAYVPRDHPDLLAWLAGGGLIAAADLVAKSQDQLDAEAAAAYPKLRALAQMTPAQARAWVDANVNSLAEAKDALKTLAVAITILARRI